MQISGQTRVYLILGDPVEQVRAPLVFNRLFQEHDVDAVLVPVQVPEKNSVQFVSTVMQQSSIAGLWLTIPHKTSVVPLLRRADRLATVSGAVNAVRRGMDGELDGALFDGLGFVKALDFHQISIAGKCALIVGAGGAGLAIGTALAQRGVEVLHFADIDMGRAEAAAALVSGSFGIHATVSDSALGKRHDLVVNATPVGLKPTDPLPFDVDQFDGGTVVVDILMPRQPTALMRACATRGITAVDGHEMLIQQIPDYLRFFGYEDIALSVAGDLQSVREQLAGSTT